MNDLILYLKAYHVNAFVVVAAAVLIFVAGIVVYSVTEDSRQARRVKKFNEQWEKEHPKEQA